MPVAIANGLALPSPLSNGTVNDAIPVMADFNYLLAALNRALIDSGGGAGVNAQSVQIHNLANGTSANDAINLSQLGGYAALTGAAFTGAVSIASTLSVAGAATLVTLTASGLITGNSGFVGTFLSLSGTSSALAYGASGQVNTYGVGYSHTRVGQVGYHMYNQGGVAEWVTYQPAHATDDKYHIGVGSGGTITDLLVLDTAGKLTLPQGGGGLSIAGPLTLPGVLTPGTAANSVGYLGVPQSLHVANYPLVLTDASIDQTFNGTTLTCTIPANASVAFQIGTVIPITNINASPLTIAITTDTLTWSGTTTTGSRTLAQNGEARIKKVTATSWLIAGTGLS